ncbi:TlpA disulfide reductase family protein [Niabella yanshanensis]|uniref:TlpA disulfide reductase family protein n=1 Tax=Niabella yanshanensis TaxID=577386 RepID=A0ABZ0VZ25_9BACT|nr:TlpA disulfide reductase family protein [Niabella yanshanensis]WQD36290.1 TlpA disulfide reductase family protein [Niabella yanshanensis]
MTDNNNGQAVNKKNKQHFVRKHGFSILVGLIIVILFVSPEAKSWTIRQLMRTGLYNVGIEKDAAVLPQLETAFDFEDEKGMIQNTAALKGKVVFINFWASWCPPCRAEFPSIETLYSKFKNNPNVFFLMLNEDEDWAAGREYLQKKNYITPMFKIKSAAPAAIYNGTLPTTLVVDKNGKVVFRHEGFANYASEEFISQIEALIKE